jgi:hypothetical protein
MPCNYVSQQFLVISKLLPHTFLISQKHTSSYLPSEILMLCWMHHLKKKIASHVESTKDKMQDKKFHDLTLKENNTVSKPQVHKTLILVLQKVGN